MTTEPNAVPSIESLRESLRTLYLRAEDADCSMAAYMEIEPADRALYDALTELDAHRKRVAAATKRAEEAELANTPMVLGLIRQEAEQRARADAAEQREAAARLALTNLLRHAEWHAASADEVTEDAKEAIREARKALASKPKQPTGLRYEQSESAAPTEPGRGEGENHA